MGSAALSFALLAGFSMMSGSLTGCGLLSPAFVNIIDPGGETALTTIDNAPGHVIVTLVNNAVVDERLLSFLESAGGGSLTLTNAQRQNLHPRLRIRVRITFTDGSFQTIEFISGSSILVDQNFNSESLPDLNQNDFTIAVVRCDVARVDLEPNTNIEVFVPSPLNVYQLMQTTTANGAIDNSFLLTGTVPPRFRVMQIDETDPDGNVTIRRNIGVRDVPSPTVNPLCGSVVAIVVDGVLSVPFLDGVDDSPSFDQNDINTSSTVGGRYEFLVSVQ